MKSSVLHFSAVLLLAMAAPSCAWKVYDYKTDASRQERIVDAYYHYLDQEKKRPSSLGEMVAKGHLPERSYDYSRYLDLSPFQLKPRYDQSDYRIFPKRKGSSRILAGRDENGEWHFSGITMAYVSDKERARKGGER